MPFGLWSAPATIQRAMNVNLSSVTWPSALVYLDDIIIFSKSFMEHILHVQKALTFLRDVEIILKLKTCFFLAKWIAYIGHVIKPGRHEIASIATKATQDLKYPTD